MAQSVKPLTLDFGSRHDLEVCETELCIGLCATEQGLLGILAPLSLPLPCLRSLSSLSLKINKHKKKKNQKAVVNILLSKYTSKKIARYRNGYYMTIKGSIFKKHPIIGVPGWLSWLSN